MANYLKRLQWLLVIQLALASGMIALSLASSDEANSHHSIGVASTLLGAICFSAIYAFYSRGVAIGENAALEVRLTDLEAELKELKAKQTNSGTNQQ